MKNSEAKNRVMRDFGYLRRFALPPPGVAAALGSLLRLCSGGHYCCHMQLACYAYCLLSLATYATDVMNNKR